MSSNPVVSHCRLWGMRCYLSGAMDKASDNGIQWRERLSRFLFNLGVIILDPTNKPIDIGQETIEDKEYRKRLKRQNRFDELQTGMKPVRSVDLRMDDIADFIIVNFDNDIRTCGTHEEYGWANRCKKPVLVRCVQGKREAPDWMFAMFPHQHIFGSWSALKKYLIHIHRDNIVDDMRRWIFFDYTQFVPKVSVEESVQFASTS